MLRNILVLSCIWFCACNSFAQTDNESFIRWSENRKLKWSDFIFEESYSTNDMEKAIIFPMIKCHFTQINNKLSVDVDVVMDKNKSFTSDTITLVLLAHEQLHFDIAELYGRMIRKQTDEFIQNKNMSYERIGKFIRTKLDEYEKFQAKYDLETKHGTDNKQQQLWNKKIKQMLDDLSTFKTH